MWVVGDWDSNLPLDSTLRRTQLQLFDRSLAGELYNEEQPFFLVLTSSVSQRVRRIVPKMDCWLQCVSGSFIPESQLVVISPSGGSLTFEL